MTFAEVKKDYLKLITEYGYPDDMTGGFVDAEQMEKVILNPTKENAKKYMCDVLAFGFQRGPYWKTEDKKFMVCDDEFLIKMYDKYAY